MESIDYCSFIKYLFSIFSFWVGLFRESVEVDCYEVCRVWDVLFLRFHHSLGDSLPTAGKWKEDFSAKGVVVFF